LPLFLFSVLLQLVVIEISIHRAAQTGYPALLQPLTGQPNSCTATTLLYHSLQTCCQICPSDRNCDPRRACLLNTCKDPGAGPPSPASARTPPRSAADSAQHSMAQQHTAWLSWELN
jgi:hypothetical protein